LQLQVKSVPTLIVYKNGEEIGRVVGKKEEQLRAMIDENM
jgi:thioredoxin-like negative regulator of GroEL